MEAEREDRKARGEAEKRRKLPKWIPWWDAFCELADALEETGLDVIPAHAAAGQSLFDQIRDGALPAKPKDRGGFSLTFTTTDAQEEFGLDPKGLIPRMFWTYFAEVREELAHDDDARLTEVADQNESTFELRKTKWRKDGGVLEGYAADVRVHRPSVAGLKKRRGERDKGHDRRGYGAAVARIIREIDAEEGYEAKKAAKRAGILRERDVVTGSSPQSAEKHLRAKLLTAGYGEEALARTA